MTVAAGIEIVTGWYAQPGQSQILAGTSGNEQPGGWAGAASGGSSELDQGSFLSSWQAVMASQGDRTDQDEADAGGMDSSIAASPAGSPAQDVNWGPTH